MDEERLVADLDRETPIDVEDSFKDKNKKKILMGRPIFQHQTNFIMHYFLDPFDLEKSEN